MCADLAQLRSHMENQDDLPDSQPIKHESGKQCEENTEQHIDIKVSATSAWCPFVAKMNTHV